MGRFVRLDVMSLEDAAGLHAVYTDPAVYTQGFIMRPPPPDLAATRANTAENIAAGAVPGRTAYTVRLTGEGGLGDGRHGRGHVVARATSTSRTSGSTSAGRCTGRGGGAPR